MKKVAWKRISQFRGPEESPGFLLWQVSTRWRRLVEASLAPLGLTHPQFVLLASLGWLTREGGEVTQVELARHFATDITMTSQVLRTLERKGYIDRYQREGDERAKLPLLTAQGTTLTEQAVLLVEKVDRDFFEKIKKESKKFNQILKLL